MDFTCSYPLSSSLGYLLGRSRCFASRNSSVADVYSALALSHAKSLVEIYVAFFLVVAWSIKRAGDVQSTRVETVRHTPADHKVLRHWHIPRSPMVRAQHRCLTRNGDSASDDPSRLFSRASATVHA
jgi:hypothetical protein